MSSHGTKRLAGLALLAGLMLALAGCAGAATPAQPVINPTIVIVQYVTQVVATITPAPPVATPVPATQKPPASTGFDPYSVQPYFPLKGCAVASRLSVGDMAYVAIGQEQFGIHYSRDVGFSPIARKLVPGEILYIIDNATCNRNGLVWKVLADSDDTIGFVLEGNGEVYWLMPLGQTFDQKAIRDRIKKIENP